MSEPVCYRVPLEHYPGMNSLVLDWLHGDERFLPRGDVGPRPSAAAGGGGPTPDLIRALSESNRRWGLNVDDELRRWSTGETTTIIAGQQVGFAGGPLYTIVKLASLLKMKRENEGRGIPTTVFFWLATEDHDFDEVANIVLPNRAPHRQSDLVHLRATRSGDARQMVGPQRIPETLIEAFLQTTGIPRPSWLRDGITFADSFAELVVTVAGGEKFILIDSLLPELRHAAAPLLEKILARWHDLQHEMETRSAAIQKAGHTPQVTPRPGEPYTLLFRVDENGRREIVRGPNGEHPERLSNSALTRVLSQNFVLRPDVFLGGPAEVAYFAQITPLHALLDVPTPRAALRGHVLVVPRNVVRHFAKYGINPEEIFTTPDKILSSQDPRGVGEIRSIAAAAERDLQEQIEKIRQLALPADHAVARSINRSIGHISYHFRKLTERAIRGLVRKDRERYNAARELVSTLFPDGQVQDRVVAWLPFWLDFGKHFVDRVIGEVEPDAPIFKIVSL